MRLTTYLWKKSLVLTACFLAAVHMAQAHLISIYFQPLYRKWVAISPPMRGVMVGIAIALITNVFHDADVFRKAEDAGFDWMIQMYRGVPRVAKTDVHPVTFLDIDERSYRHWGEPLSIPRDKITKLIRYAVDGRASVIIVDVELSRPSGGHDNELRDYLKSVSKNLSTPPDIIFARGLRFPSEADHGLMEQRPSFLDDVVAENTYLHWAAPLYELEDDAVIRRWHLWEATCFESGSSGKRTVVGLPSFQLLASSLLNDNDATSILKTAFLLNLPDDCNKPAKQKNNDNDSALTLDGFRFSLKESDIGRRILYSIPRRLRDGEMYPTIFWQGDSDYPSFSVKPAVVVTEGAIHSVPDLTGHVVIIGASYVDSRDTYSTPLGVMPGSMIVANSFLSLFQNGEAHQLAWWWRLFFEALIVATAAYIFAKLKGFIAKLTASIATLFVLLPASIYLFKSGVWLDFAIPLAAVEFYAMFGDIEEKLGQNIPHKPFDN